MTVWRPALTRSDAFFLNKTGVPSHSLSRATSPEMGSLFLSQTVPTTTAWVYSTVLQVLYRTVLYSNLAVLYRTAMGWYRSDSATYSTQCIALLYCGSERAGEKVRDITGREAWARECCAFRMSPFSLSCAGDVIGTGSTRGGPAQGSLPAYPWLVPWRSNQPRVSGVEPAAAATEGRTLWLSIRSSLTTGKAFSLWPHSNGPSLTVVSQHWSLALVSALVSPTHWLSHGTVRKCCCAVSAL